MHHQLATSSTTVNKITPRAPFTKVLHKFRNNGHQFHQGHPSTTDLHGCVKNRQPSTRSFKSKRPGGQTSMLCLVMNRAYTKKKRIVWPHPQKLQNDFRHHKTQHLHKPPIKNKIGRTLALLVYFSWIDV
jgi:hypothetical protein